jgi:hypothetical protein
MRTKQWIWIAVLCVIGLSLASSFDWAPADASHLGQTVPTRTPTAAPVTPTPEPPRATEPPPVSTVPSIDSSPTATPVFLLPTAGDSGTGGLQFVGVIGFGLTLLAWAIRLRVRGKTR